MQSSAPYAAMVLVQLSYGGSNILMKIALEKDSINYFTRMEKVKTESQEICHKSLTLTALSGCSLQVYQLYMGAILIDRVLMVSCGEEARPRNKRYILVDLQQRNLQISKKILFYVQSEVAEIDPLLLFKGKNDELLCIPLKRKQFMNMQARAPYAEMGLNLLVFAVYRHIIAMTLLGPFAFVIERMEKVKTASPRGWAKMLGAAICTSGSLFFIFWKGGYLFNFFQNRPLINIYTKGSADQSDEGKGLADGKTLEISIND
uniref:WAT1-related protein n=1 Tax=Salix viminalis TaxID=40686 RepID=A0A6N2MT62_SALVM